MLIISPKMHLSLIIRTVQIDRLPSDNHWLKNVIKKTASYIINFVFKKYISLRNIMFSLKSIFNRLHA